MTKHVPVLSRGTTSSMASKSSSSQQRYTQTLPTFLQVGRGSVKSLEQLYALQPSPPGSGGNKNLFHVISKINYAIFRTFYPPLATNKLGIKRDSKEGRIRFLFSPFFLFVFFFFLRLLCVRGEQENEPRTVGGPNIQGHRRWTNFDLQKRSLSLTVLTADEIVKIMFNETLKYKRSNETCT